MVINAKNYKNYGGFSKVKATPRSTNKITLSGLGTANRMGWNLDRRSYGMGDTLDTAGSGILTGQSDPNSVSSQNYDIYQAAGVNPNFTGTQLQAAPPGSSTLMYIALAIGALFLFKK